MPALVRAPVRPQALVQQQARLRKDRLLLRPASSPRPTHRCFQNHHLTLLRASLPCAQLLDRAQPLGQALLLAQALLLGLALQLGGWSLVAS